MTFHLKRKLVMSIIHVPDLDVTRSLDSFMAKGITGGANVTIVEVPVGQSGVTNVVTPDDDGSVVVVNNNNPSATTNIIFSKPSSVA
jgi:hypothetical protein